MTVILVNAEAGRIPLPAGVVHCSVSSPPYYSLRAYQGDQARERLGLNAWDAWHEGGDREEVVSLKDLPMFKGMAG